MCIAYLHISVPSTTQCSATILYRVDGSCDAERMFRVHFWALLEVHLEGLTRGGAVEPSWVAAKLARPEANPWHISVLSRSLYSRTGCVPTINRDIVSN
eukprot:SAG31_NODE_30790_length_376_cov_0.664260_1_plen_98_part_01